MEGEQFFKLDRQEGDRSPALIGAEGVFTGVTWDRLKALLGVS